MLFRSLIYRSFMDLLNETAVNIGDPPIAPYGAHGEVEREDDDDDERENILFCGFHLRGLIRASDLPTCKQGFWTAKP